MTIREVKRLLRRRGITQTDLARKAKVSTAAMALFINRKMTSARLEKLVLKELGVSADEYRPTKKAVGE